MTTARTRAAPPTPVEGEAADAAAEADGPAKPGRVTRRRTSPPLGGSERRPAGVAVGRRTFPRAERPASVPVPQHHHLPGWVRRDFARVRPALGDLLALLEGDAHHELQRRVDEVTQAIGEGRFSAAWQYPEIVADGRRLYDEQRRHQAEAARSARALDTARRRAQAHLRDSQELLGAEASARLQRTLRDAGDPAAVAAVETEAERAVDAARGATSKRRDREIERTRARIQRVVPHPGEETEPDLQPWQEVLRRFAEQQTGSDGDGAAS